MLPGMHPTLIRKLDFPHLLTSDQSGVSWLVPQGHILFACASTIKIPN